MLRSDRKGADIQAVQPAVTLSEIPVGSWRISREGAPVAAVALRNERGNVVVAAEVEGAADAAPYCFDTVEAADSFIGDLLASFAYLGCDVARD